MLLQEETRQRKGAGLFPTRPRRLEQVFQSYDAPVYFITFNTAKRRRLLAKAEVHECFREYARRNEASGRAVGRYVIMPDHVHLFVRLGREDRLSVFVQLLKQSISKVLRESGEVAPFWQPGFFDHMLRHAESYSEKWVYVRENPVRAKLVSRADDWPYQGEVVVIRF